MGEQNLRPGSDVAQVVFPSRDPTTAMSRKPLLLIPLLAIAAAAYFFLRPSTDQTADSDRLTLYGNVEIREARLAFNGSGHLLAVNVEEGDKVETGQVLARLDTELLQRTLQQTEAQVGARRAQLDKLLAGSRPEEIASAKAGVAAARAHARSARDTARRLESLLKRKSVSPEEVELARAGADAAAADLDAAQQKLKLLEAGPRQEDIAAARADLVAAQAAQSLAQQHLDDAVLKAPQDGIVRDRLTEPGEFVTPQNPVLSLAFVSPVWVRAYIPETLLGKVRPGMSATIHTDSYPDKSYPGWVGFISPTAEFTPKSVQTPELRTRLVYEIRVHACNPGGELRLGMPATVQLDLTDNGNTDANAGAGRCPQ
jgi:HlyD family secretion protein